MHLLLKGSWSPTYRLRHNRDHKQGAQSSSWAHAVLRHTQSVRPLIHPTKVNIVLIPKGPGKGQMNAGHKSLCLLHLPLRPGLQHRSAQCPAQHRSTTQLHAPPPTTTAPPPRKPTLTVSQPHVLKPTLPKPPCVPSYSPTPQPQSTQAAQSTDLLEIPDTPHRPQILHYGVQALAQRR